MSAAAAEGGRDRAAEPAATLPPTGWAAALAGLPDPLQPRPFHAASQLAHCRSLGAAGLQPWRILEVLDRAGDPALWPATAAALAVERVELTDIAACLRPAAAPPQGPAGELQRFDLIFLHPGCDRREEFRALVAHLKLRLASDGFWWVQAIDPVFAPAHLPPAGRSLPAVSALMAELAAAGLHATVRCRRANYAPEILAQTPGSLAIRQQLDHRFLQGFPPAPRPPIDAREREGLQPVPTPTWRSLGLPSGLLATVIDRDGLGAAAADAAGAWYRPVQAGVGHVALSLRLPSRDQPPIAGEPAQHPSFVFLRCCFAVNPEARLAPFVWLAAPAFRLRGRERPAAELATGVQEQVWAVAAAGELAHLLIRGAAFTRLYGARVELLAPPVEVVARGDTPAATDKTQAAILERLSRDLGARHRAAAAVLGRLPVGARILDVGGGPGLLAALLPGQAVTTVDTDHAAEHPDFLRLSAPAATGGRLPFDAGSFDAVAAIDVLEHIPAAARAGFVAELARVARTGLYLACPVDSPAAQAGEAALAAMLPDGHAFLAEHREFGLPAAAAVAQWLAAAGRSGAAVQAGATVAQWLGDTARDLGLAAPPACPTAAAETVYRQSWWWSAEPDFS